MGAIAVSAIFASAAAAADVSVSGTTITYAADPGEANGLTVTHPGGDYQFDDSAPLAAGANCTDPSPAETDSAVTCTDTGPMTVVVNLDDNSDSASAAGLNQDPFTLNGQSGNDTLAGSAVNDQLDGGPDLDTLINGAGDDILIGGTQGDNVNYLLNTAAQPIDVTLDGNANDDDGLGGTDNVGTDIELINGGAGDDTVDASAIGPGFVQPVELRGFDGDDTLTGSNSSFGDFVQGGDGADTLNGLDGGDGFRGGGGNDTINGGPGNEGSTQGGDGNDKMNGGDGDDAALEGGSGNDKIWGGAGTDSVGHPTEDTGNDRLRGGTGADALNGGPGIDRVGYGDHAAGVAVTIDGNANDGNDTDDADGVGPPFVPADNVGTTVEAITGSPAGDTLIGSCANNTFFPGAGGDVVGGDPDAGCATPGNDLIDPGANLAGAANGNDSFNGGGGTDTVTYKHNTATQGISVDLDGTFDDADGSGGTDNVQSNIEIVRGTDDADTINADFAAVTAGVRLFGQAGDDTLTGSDLNDQINGGANDTAAPGDTLDCQDGTDKFRNGETVSNCEIAF